MPYLLIAHSRHVLAPGRLIVALDEGKPSLVSGGSTGVLALDVAPTGRAVALRLTQDDEIAIDGVVLGAEPRELEHGAKIHLGGARIVFGDDAAAGETGRRIGLSDEPSSPLDEPLPSSPTADVGGKLVAIGDGRSFEVPAEGLEIGRDPNCDLVLRSSDASRWHASVTPSLLGYVLRDTSTNGVWVNDRRIAEQRVLGIGDIVRFGDEEFRFEAAAAKYEPSTSLRLAAMAESSAAAPRRSPTARSANAPDTRPTSASAGESSAPLLATLEIVTPGLLRGRRFRIEHPLVHIGRSAHNEVVLGDESISGSHATLQRRRDGWVVADQGSTNGTYVDGDRVQGELFLRGPCELRFGGIRAIFRPIAGSGPDGDSTRGIVGVAWGGDG